MRGRRSVRFGQPDVQWYDSRLEAEGGEGERQDYCAAAVRERRVRGKGGKAEITPAARPGAEESK